MIADSPGLRVGGDCEHARQDPSKKSCWRALTRRAQPPAPCFFRRQHDVETN